MTNIEIFEFYKKQLELKRNKDILSNKSKYKYCNCITKFINVLDVDIITAKRRDILRVLDVLDMPASEYNMTITALSHMYNVLMNTHEFIDIIEFNPCVGIVRAKTKAKEKVPLTRDEINIVLDSCTNERDFAIVTTMVQTGMRVSEVINLTLTQYLKRSENNEILLTETKGDKERIIYLNSNCTEAIDNYLITRKDSDYDNLFISNHRTPMNTNCLNKHLKFILKDCGIDKEVHNHIFRATFATIKLNDGVPLEVIQECLGHSDISTTRIYAKNNKGRIAEYMNTII